MGTDKTNYHQTLANYFAAKPLYLDEKQKKPNTRKLVELPWQQTKAEIWDNVVATLCDLYFIEAKCRNGMTFALPSDYRLAYNGLPEAQTEIAEEKKHEERIDRWTREIIEYSAKWTERREKMQRSKVVKEPEPILPEPPQSVRIWTDDEIEADSKRIIENPNRLDRLRAFECFVKAETYPLLYYTDLPGFVQQQAYNFSSSGPVYNEAIKHIESGSLILLLRRWSNSVKQNLYPAIIGTLQDQIDDIKSARITPNGRLAVSVNKEENKICIWDVIARQCIQVIKVPDNSVYSFCITPDGSRLLAGGSDNKVRLFDLKNGECLREFSGHKATVFAVDITPDGVRGISGSWDHSVRVWNLENGECLTELKGHNAAIISVAITPDGRWAVSACGYDQTLRVWNLESSVCMHILRGHSEYITSLCITPDGNYAVSGSDDKTIRLWDIRRGVCENIFTGHSDEVKSVDISADGNIIISGSCDHTLRIWERAKNCCSRKYFDSTGFVMSVSSVINGKYCLSVSDYDIIKIWDIEKGNSPNTFYIQNGVTKVVSVSDDGKRAMVGNWDNTLRLWDIEKSKSPAIIIKQHFVKEIDSSWEGEYTVFPGSDNTICVLNLKTGEIVKEIAGSSRSVTSICASENVDVIAVTEYLKNTINIFDLKKNQIRFTLDGHTDSLNCICVTGDGKRIISGAHDYTLKIWDIDKRMCLLTFRDKSCPIQISVSFDGSRIVTAHWFDKNLLVWDMESGKCHSVLTGHLNNIDTVKVTANGLYAISSSWDNTMRLWDLNCGKCLSVVYVGKRISSIGLSKNNNFIAAGTSTGEVLFFEISNL